MVVAVCNNDDGGNKMVALTNGGGNGGVVVVDVAKTRCNDNGVGDGMVDGMVVMVEAK